MSGDSFELLRDEHVDLLTKIEKSEDYSALIPTIREFIERVRRAGRFTSQVEQRDFLRSILTFWGSFVYEHSEPRQYPNIELYPLEVDVKPVAKAPMLKKWNLFPIFATIIIIVIGACILFDMRSNSIGSIFPLVRVATATPYPTYTPSLTYTPLPTDTPTPTPTATATPYPTYTPSLTYTPLPIDTPTPTPTATATPTPTPKPDAVVNVEALNLRSGPGTVYDILGVLKQGDSLKVTGRNLTGNWLKVICASGQEGWTACWLLQVNVDTDGVPVVQAPPTPTPMYTPTSTPTLILELLPPPIPLAPENGACFIGVSVFFKWQWDYRSLEPNELFSLRVCREGETKPCHHSQVHDFEYSDYLSYCSAGEHYWQVALVRQLCEDCPEEDKWQAISEPSEKQWIYYTPPEEEGWEPPGPQEPPEPEEPPEPPR